MAISGPRPIDTVGNCQKSGISFGCGYEDRPAVHFLTEVVQLVFGQAAFEVGAAVHAGRGVALK